MYPDVLGAPLFENFSADADVSCNHWSQYNLIWFTLNNISIFIACCVTAFTNMSLESITY